MSHLLVYATAESRLHADLVVVRLRKAGIAARMISVLHPPSVRPNSALCWLEGASSMPLSSGGSAEVSGLFRLSLSKAGRHGGSALAERLGHLGLTHEQGLNIEESILENRLVIMVEVHDEFELPAIYHTLRGLAVEKVHTADIDRRAPEVVHGLNRYRPALSLSAFPFSYAVAAA